MAEMLIKVRASPSRAWRRGDIVVIMPDGHEWGTLEFLGSWVASGRHAELFPGDFFVVKIPGVTVTRLKVYLADWVDTLDLGPRRLWRLLLDELTQALLNKLRDEGFLTMGVDFTRAQLEARVRRKDTEATADFS